MTNLQCYSYALITLNDMGIKIDRDKFYAVMFSNWDIYHENIVESLARILYT